MAEVKQYEMLPDAAPHTDHETGTVYKSGDIIETDKPLDKLYKGKFRLVGQQKPRRPRDQDSTLDQSGGRQMDTPAAPTAARQAGRNRPKTAAKDQEVVHRETGKDPAFAEEEDEEENPKPQKASVAEVDDEENPEVEEEKVEDEVEKDEENPEVESEFGEVVTSEFRGAKKAGLIVFQDQETELYTVARADRPTKPINKEELKTKASVKRIVEENKE